MSGFTYEIPNGKRYLQALLIKLGEKGRDYLAYHLSWCTCSITKTNSFSQYRWDGYYTIIDFEVPINIYPELVKSISEEDKTFIINVCREIMPPKNGLDVMEIRFNISLNEEPKRVDALAELAQATSELSYKISSEILLKTSKKKQKKCLKSTSILIAWKML
jgi:hypothetical protein